VTRKTVNSAKLQLESSLRSSCNKLRFVQHNLNFFYDWLCLDFCPTMTRNPSSRRPIACALSINANTPITSINPDVGSRTGRPPAARVRPRGARATWRSALPGRWSRRTWVLEAFKDPIHRRVAWALRHPRHPVRVSHRRHPLRRPGDSTTSIRYSTNPFRSFSCNLL